MLLFSCLLSPFSLPNPLEICVVCCRTVLPRVGNKGAKRTIQNKTESVECVQPCCFTYITLPLPLTTAPPFPPPSSSLTDTDVDNEVLLYLAQLHKAGGTPRLRSLDLTGNPAVTDIGIAALGHHCTSLETINLNGCSPGITNQGFAQLAKGCPNLRVNEPANGGGRLWPHSHLHTHTTNQNAPILSDCSLRGL